MKKRRFTRPNRFLILLLVLILVLPVFLTGETAYAMQQPGRIYGVNYARILENKDLCTKVYFFVGRYQFEGELRNGVTLTNDEVDEVIHGVMNDMGITSGMLLCSENIIQKAKTEIRGFDPAMALRIGLDLAGLGCIADVYDVYNGNKQAPEAMAGIVAGQFIGEVAKFATGAKWIDIAFNAFMTTDKIVAEWDRLEIEEALAKEAVNREAMLSMFYAECNERLRRAEAERGSLNWKLTANCSRYKAKPFFGIDVGQTVSIRVDMERVNRFGNDTNTNWSGLYEGDITIYFRHDLTQFDNNFEHLFDSNVSMIRDIPNMALMKGDTNDRSTLTKRITLSGVQVNLDRQAAHGNLLSTSIPLAGATDESSFHLARGATYGYNGTGYNMGVLDLDGLIHCEVFVDNACRGGFRENNRYPVIIWDNMDVTSVSRATFVGTSDYSFQKEMDHAILVDYGIFKDLESGKIRIWIKNLEPGR